MAGVIPKWVGFNFQTLAGAVLVAGTGYTAYRWYQGKPVLAAGADEESGAVDKSKSEPSSAAAEAAFAELTKAGFRVSRQFEFPYWLFLEERKGARTGAAKRIAERTARKSGARVSLLKVSDAAGKESLLLSFVQGPKS